MIHRHLDYPKETPPERLPVAALVDLLERGDLDDWQPLAAAIARDPHGDLAQRVERLLDAYPLYGTSPLWRAFLERVRAARPARGPGRVSLRQLRRRRGLTQTALGERMRMTQSDVSKLEQRRDARLSTLQRFVRSLGGRLRLMASLPDADLELDLGDEPTFTE